MPQFDFYSFSGQVFWTLFGFSIFYFFILRFYLTRFSEMFKMRQKLLSLHTKMIKGSSFSTSIYDSFLFIVLTTKA